jgi:CheY-specific phosphatase CheX
MTAPFCELVDTATSAVLETMFLTGVERYSDWSEIVPSATGGESLGVHLRFEGALAGEFQLRMAQSTALSLASTMLCLEEDELNHERAVELAGELTNMICGSLLSHIAPEGSLTLGSPELSPAVTPLEGGTNRRFDLPEGCLAVAFRLDGHG